jgi:hypothetical protein
MSGPTLEIVPTRRVGVAPAGIAFAAVARGWGVARAGEDLRFAWEFGDPDGGAFTAVDRVAAVWGASRDTAFSDRAAHVFHPPRAAFAAAGTPGAPARTLTFRVRCTATDGARAVTATQDVAIENPDAVFAGERTVLVSPDGDFSGAPDDPFGPGYARARRHRGRPGDRRVLYRRGAAHDVAEPLAVVARVERGGQVGAWGAGPRPRLRTGVPSDPKRAVLADIRTLPARAEFALWGLDCVSSWDAATETARGGAKPWNGVNLGARAEGHVTVHGCRLAGFSTGLRQNAPASRVVISGTDVTGWQNYGMLASRHHVLALVGTRVEQGADAMGGGALPLAIRGTDNEQNDHGPLRLSNPSARGFTLLSQVQLRSTNGWSQGRSWAQDTDGRRMPRPSHQPCLRWNVGGVTGAVLRVDRAVTEGGRSALNTTILRDRRNPTKRCDAILDKLITVGTANNGGLVWASEFTDSVCRNFLAIVPPSTWELRPPEALIHFGGGPRSIYDALALAGSLRIYSGTVLDWSEIDKDVLRLRMPDGLMPAEVTLSNVVRHAPRLGEDLSPALELVRLFDPSYRGLKWQNRQRGAGPVMIRRDGTVTEVENYLDDVADAPVADPVHATPREAAPGVATVSAPFPRPGALRAALGPGERVALDDLLGRLRGPLPSSGALEPL